MAPSAIHRFINNLSRLITIAQKALGLVLQENPASAICRDIVKLTVRRQKYNTKDRKNILVQCLKFFAIRALFQQTFKTSIFTKLATLCQFR